MSKRSGEAQAALGRRAPTMKHRLEPRGGARNEQADALDELADDGLVQPYEDSDTPVDAEEWDADTCRKCGGSLSVNHPEGKWCY